MTAHPLKRLRTIQFTIAPAVVMDDGDTLTPVQLGTLTVPADQIGEFAEKYAADLAEKEREINDPKEEGQ